MTEKIEYVMIPVFPKTKERLDCHGNKNETYDELLNRVLEIFEKYGGKKGPVLAVSRITIAFVSPQSSCSLRNSRGR